MGQLYAHRIQALDVNGNPINGAKLYLYDSVATTTPKAAYTNNGLTIAHTFPIVADPSGVFPQIYATSGVAYYAVLKTSAGVLVDDFDFVTSLGADDATSLLKDFGTGGRFQARGSAGTVYIEVGDPLGDDIGGTGRVGGWNGTQGTLLTVDMATVTLTGNLTVAGNITVTGNETVSGNMAVTGTLDVTGATSFMQKLSSGTATAAADVTITLSASYGAYVIYLFDIVTSAAASLVATLSFDGTNYKTAAGDYIGSTKDISGATTTSTGSDTNMVMGPATASAALYGAATLTLRSAASVETVMMGHLSRYNTAGNSQISWPFVMTNAKAYGKAQKIKIAPGSGTLTLKYVLFGIPGL